MISIRSIEDILKDAVDKTTGAGQFNEQELKVISQIVKLACEETKNTVIDYIKEYSDTYGNEAYYPIDDFIGKDDFFNGIKLEPALNIK